MRVTLDRCLRNGGRSISANYREIVAGSRGHLHTPRVFIRRHTEQILLSPVLQHSHMPLCPPAQSGRPQSPTSPTYVAGRPQSSYAAPLTSPVARRRLTQRHFRMSPPASVASRPADADRRGSRRRDWFLRGAISTKPGNERKTSGLDSHWSDSPPPLPPKPS